LSLAGVLMFADVGPQLERFINTPEGVQLTSLTGRDRIWAIAWEEWARNPVFGHGPGIWDERFRASIGMANATHAHNQFMDTLSRAGTVGAAGLTLYAAVLLTMSLRFARATQGLSLGLFLALLLRSISEVPLLMFGYSPDLIIHVLLLMVLASATRQASASAPLAATRSTSHWRAGAHARP
jgi:O-antigen ligase